MLLETIKGWKVKGLAVGYVLLILIDKLAFDIPAFDPGVDWVNQILIGLGIFAARDAADNVADKAAGK